MRWFQLTANGETFVGKYLDYALIDGVSRPLQVTNSDDGEITLSLPHFWNYAVFDPGNSALFYPEYLFMMPLDFSVLLDVAPSSSCSKSDYDKNYKIIIVSTPAILTRLKFVDQI